MRMRFWVLWIAGALAAAGCSSTGAAPAPPGPSNPGTGVSSPNPNIVPPTTPPPNPAPTVPPAASAPAIAPVAPVPAEPPVPPPPAAAVPAQAPAPAVDATSRPYQDVLKLKQAGLSDEFILNKVRTENVNYRLNTAEIVELRSAGVSETVLEVMLRSGQPPAAVAGAAVARRAEFSGLARVGKGFIVFGTSTKNVGRLVVDGETMTWTGSADADKNFSVYARNIKEIFNTCVLRPNQNLCLEIGFVTYTGEEYKFRDPGWKNGENRLVTEVTNYFKQAFPNLFFSARPVNEL
ncbi:MAG: hypothetical protein LC796_03620 [Acidobacteria bacterium]|nr:hypothetical protein [Acidobacteriota bacterium]MCA1611431.1 hypothetical protein [Acidobacteriota bacterium]